MIGNLQHFPQQGSGGISLHRKGLVALAVLALAQHPACAQDSPVGTPVPAVETAAVASEVEITAEVVDAPAIAASGEPEATATEPPPPPVTIPRLTTLVVELLATLSSETSTQGDHFPIRLFEPIVIDGVTVIPAGTMGEGEVIHAKHKGGMGAAGELIITARFLDVHGQRLPLRSLRVNGDGQSRIDTVNSIAVASAATLPLASLVGFFITGGAKTVNEGTVATARTAEDFAVPAAADPVAMPVAEPQAPPETTAPVEQAQQEGSNLEVTSE